MSVWKTLSRIDVSEHTEKKGNFTYLSWAWAWGQLKDSFPEATFVKHEYEGLPYMEAGSGDAYVKVSVTVGDHTLTETMPVLNHQNKSVKNPDSFTVNTSLQRCLAKAIAMHGLGHYIYAGEDLPPAETVDAYSPETVKLFAQKIQEAMISDDFAVIGRALVDNQEVFQKANTGTPGKGTGYFTSKEKGAQAKYGDRYQGYLQEYVDGLNGAEQAQDADAMAELLSEISENDTDKRLVWGRLESQTQAWIKSNRAV